jgi:hypothetical protein
MKKKTITIALFAVLGTMAVSCQKETINELSPIVSHSATAYTVTYYVDGVRVQTRVNSDEELSLLLNQLAALAREGHRVTVHKGNTATQSVTKEKVTFTTNNKDEAVAWCNAMILDGYAVEMYFDEETGQYICVAIK